VPQRGFRVLVDQLAGGDQVARHRIGRGSVQGAQFAPDFRRQLLGLDPGRYRRPTARVVRRAIALGIRPGRAARLHGARAARARPAAWGRAPSSFAALTLPVVDHSGKDTGGFGRAGHQF